MRNGGRNGRLSDATGADEGDEALVPHQRTDVARRLVAPDNAVERARQPRWRCERRRRLQRGVRSRSSRHDCDEGVAATRDVLHELGAVLAIAEDLAKRGDVDAQGALFDGDVRPDAIRQLLFGHHLARALRQRDENVKRPVANPDRSAIAFEAPLAHVQPEVAEGEHAGVNVHAAWLRGRAPHGRRETGGTLRPSRPKRLSRIARVLRKRPQKRAGGSAAARAAPGSGAHAH